MEILLLRQAIVLMAAAIAAYTDLKTGYIYDWLTVPAIVLGAILCIIEQQWIGIGIGATVFFVGYAGYYAGKIGGGDMKLFTAIALLLPLSPGTQYPFIIIVLIYSAITAIIALASYYVVRYAGKGIDWGYNKKSIKYAAVTGAILALYLVVVGSTGYVGLEKIIAFALVFGFGLLFLALEKGIRKEFFVKKARVGELEEDETIAWDFLGRKEKKKIGELGIKRIIDKKVLEKLKKEKIREVLVYRDMPRFGVFIFLGVLIAIVFPELATALLW